MNNDELREELEQREELRELKRTIRDIYNMTEQEKQNAYNRAADAGLWASDYGGGGVT